MEPVDPRLNLRSLRVRFGAGEAGILQVLSMRNGPDIDLSAGGMRLMTSPLCQ